MTTFIILPLRNTGGLWFFNDYGQTQVVVLFAPLVALCLALLISRVRQVLTAVAVVLMVGALIQQVSGSWGAPSGDFAVVTVFAIGLAIAAFAVSLTRAAPLPRRRVAEVPSNLVGGAHPLTIIRTTGSVLLAVAALWIFFGLAPKNVTLDASARVASVMAADASNQSRAEGAPQQAVVNGWTARDLLEIIATQQQPQPRDERPAALLTLAVVGIALGLLTSPTLRGPVRTFTPVLGDGDPPN
ncbi:hypothetical protein [Terrabacter ginsenosidimutans]